MGVSWPQQRISPLFPSWPFLSKGLSRSLAKRRQSRPLTSVGFVQGAWRQLNTSCPVIVLGHSEPFSRGLRLPTLPFLQALCPAQTQRKISQVNVHRAFKGLSVIPFWPQVSYASRSVDILNSYRKTQSGKFKILPPDLAQCISKDPQGYQWLSEQWLSVLAPRGLSHKRTVDNQTRQNK